MRIAVGGIEHETNTYATQIMGTTGLDDFHVLTGDEILKVRGLRTFIGGFIDAADAAGHEVVPTLAAIAGPSGIIEAAAYQSLKQGLLDRLVRAGPVDAVALAMHGAGVVEGIEDLESDLAMAVKEAVGNIPLVVPLDLHGNITPEMGESIDVMLGVHEYPHTDCYERAAECIELLPQLVSGELIPTTAVVQLPILLPTSTTDEGPAAVMRDLCLAAEADANVIDAALFHGFPYTDIAATGSSIVVTTNNDRELAQQIANRLAAKMWASRNDFLSESTAPEVALELAQRVIAERGGPVVINDTADNPGGGTPGDGTHLLGAMISAGLSDACFGFVFDPAVATQAHQAGVGSTIKVSLGGKHGPLHGPSLELEAYVKTLTDGRFVYTNQMMAGLPANYGPSARLVVGGQRGRGGLDIIVTSRRSQTFDPGVFELHGIDVEKRSIVGLKGSQHFRAGFREIATAMIAADSPGLTTIEVTVFDHPNSGRSLWPIDPELDWTPQD